MKRCIKCGKKGFLLKLNQKKVCSDCIRLSKIEEQEKLTFDRLTYLDQRVNDREKLILEIQQEALLKIENQILERNNVLENLNHNMNEQTQKYEELKAQSDSTEKLIKTNKNKIEKIKNLYKSLKYSVDHETPESIDVDAEITRYLPTVQLHLHNWMLNSYEKNLMKIKKISIRS
jgi:chromosome segregation ATPase